MGWKMIRSAVASASVAVLVMALTPSAIARELPQQGGPSTAGAIVQIQAFAKSDLRLSVAARADQNAVPWATVILRADDYRVHSFEAHRVAVLTGTDSCGGEEAVADDHSDTVRVAVRGVTQLSDGREVQIWIDGKDNGSSGDLARVRIRERHGGDEGGCGGGGHEDGTGDGGHDEGGDEGGCGDDGHEDGCSGSGGGGSGRPWEYDSGWKPVAKVFQKVVPAKR